MQGSKIPDSHTQEPSPQHQQSVPPLSSLDLPCSNIEAAPTFDLLKSPSSDKIQAFQDFMADPSHKTHDVEYTHLKKEAFERLLKCDTWLNGNVST